MLCFYLLHLSLCPHTNKHTHTNTHTHTHNILYRLLKNTCFNCHHFKMGRQEVSVGR